MGEPLARVGLSDALASKNLGRGSRGHIRAVQAHDVTSRVRGRWRARRNKVHVLLVYARDMNGVWFAALAVEWLGGAIDCVGLAELPAPTWDEEILEAVERETGFTHDEIRALYRDNAPAEAMPSVSRSDRRLPKRIRNGAPALSEVTTV